MTTSKSMAAPTQKTDALRGWIISCKGHGDLVVVIAHSETQAAALAIPAILHDRPDLEPVVDELVASGWPTTEDLQEVPIDRPAGFVLEGG